MTDARAALVYKARSLIPSMVSCSAWSALGQSSLKERVVLDGVGGEARVGAPGPVSVAGRERAVRDRVHYVPGG